ncbi:MAG: hypothetical protein Q8L47_00090 [bacterium]|nr:hypothetical protein [bacterium]
MPEDKISNSTDTLLRAATVIELLGNSLENLGGTFRRVRDREIQRLCFTANQLIFEAKCQLSRSDIPKDFFSLASARIMIEQIKTWRSTIEELEEKRRDAKENEIEVSLLNFLNPEFIDKFFELARAADFLECELRNLKIGNGETVL